MIGELIGNFKIVSRLGAGGMGEVFLAEQSKIGTKVAIKLLRPELSADKTHVDRFFNEALAVSRIKHAGIVKIFDVGFVDKTGAAYLVMEFLEGESLAARIARVGRLPLAQIADVGRQIANILDATHASGITHRDLKPDNIFLVADAELASKERVKILDFGIAKLTGTMAGGAPKTVGIMGTPGYMAPEQWGDSSKVDWRADAYSVGCVVFEMAGGRQPFPAQTFPESYAKHLNDPPPHVRELAPELPEALEALIVQMLAKQPADRPAMSDIASRFEAIGKLPSTGPLIAQTLPHGSGAALVAPTIAPGEPTIAPAITPAPMTPVTPAAKPNTTLSTAAVERSDAPPPRSKTGLMVLGGLAVIGATTGIVIATRGGPDPVKDPVTDPIARPAPDARVEDPVPKQETLRQQIDRANPFVDAGGAKLQTHQVTNQEYDWYLKSLANADAAKPLSAPGAPTEPVAWVTFERARRFCEAIDASLPSDELWVRAAGGDSSGLDPANAGTRGPLQEWTATVHDGLATVRGAWVGMPKEDLALVAEGPLMKPTESLAGIEQPTIVASARIGFRCAR